MLEIFVGLYAGKKSRNPYMHPQLNQLQLPQFYHLSIINQCWLLTWASSHQLSSSAKTINKTNYLVSSSWSHTAAQPCFSIKNPGFPPDGSGEHRQKCACMYVSVGLSPGRGVITCLFLSRPSTPPLRSSYRSRWEVCRKTSVLLCVVKQDVGLKLQSHTLT